ncbi:MAG: hypothetical protein ACE5D0_09225, partial [Fidelibacterota bacterium]
MDYYFRNYRVYILSFLLLMFPLTSLNSEESFCESDFQEGVFPRDCRDFINDWEDVIIRVNVHIIRNDAGGGSQIVSDEDAFLALNVLAADYEDHDIYFFIEG